MRQLSATPAQKSTNLAQLVVTTGLNTAVESSSNREDALLGLRIEFVMGTNGHRLTFLVIEAEPKDGLSTRKLLLESAKHNVITAYSGSEGVNMFRRFPNVDIVCIHTELPDLKGAKVAQTVRDLHPGIRVVALTPRMGAKCEWADRTVNSHDPSALLKLLEEMGGRTDI